MNAGNDDRAAAHRAGAGTRVKGLTINVPNRSTCRLQIPIVVIEARAAVQGRQQEAVGLEEVGQACLNRFIGQSNRGIVHACDGQGLVQIDEALRGWRIDLAHLARMLAL
jgi:hypothetical protein